MLKKALILFLVLLFPVTALGTDEGVADRSPVIAQEAFESMIEEKVSEIGGLSGAGAGSGKFPADDVAAAFEAVQPSGDEHFPSFSSDAVVPVATEPGEYGSSPVIPEDPQGERAVREINEMVKGFEPFRYEDTEGSDDTIYVHPEKKAYIRLSRTDVNRIHCEGDRTVVGFVYATDKGLEVSKSGADAFLRITPEEWAYENPFELFVMCGEQGDSDLYRMIGYPANLSTRNVILKDEGTRIRDAIDFFKGRTRDQNIAAIVKAVWEENFEESWTVIPEARARIVGKGLGSYRITLYRTILTNADWMVDVYSVQNNGSAMTVEENTFVGSDTVAVAVIDPVIETNGIGQVIVIRQSLSVETY